MTSASASVFETFISDPSINRVLTFSDVHGDIDALIINLRDNSQVIEKTGPNKDWNRNTTRDPELETLLKIDLNTGEDQYVEDLNYRWIGGNAHVVIIGDIIDPFRPPPGGPAFPSYEEHYYPQVEVKILRFLNALDRQARESGGRIIKLLGNHELYNLFVYGSYDHYIFPRDRTGNYYQGHPRVTAGRVGYFSWDRPGKGLLFDGGCGVLVLINNLAFVHAQLVDGLTLEQAERVNQLLNSPDTDLKTMFNAVGGILKPAAGSGLPNPLPPFEMPPTDPRLRPSFPEKHYLLARNYGLPSDIDRRFDDKGGWCRDTAQRHRREFCASGQCDPDRLQLFIGHCIQGSLDTPPSRDRFIDRLRNRTYSRATIDGPREIIEGGVHEGSPDLDNPFKLFGVTMECQMTGDGELFHVYRVDIGSSRAFDPNLRYFSQHPALHDHQTLATFPRFKSKSKLVNLLFRSRSPSVVEILSEAEEVPQRIRIVRSSLENTLIHQPRPRQVADFDTIFRDQPF
jgi:hypothetical protein